VPLPDLHMRDSLRVLLMPLPMKQPLNDRPEIEECLIAKLRVKFARWLLGEVLREWLKLYSEEVVHESRG
jgi:hypothetical protein